MADYMFCLHEKITSHTFIISGAFIVTGNHASAFKATSLQETV